MSDQDSTSVAVAGQDEVEVRLRAEGEALVAQVQEMTIEDDVSFVLGTEFLAGIKRGGRVVEDFMAPIVSKAHDLWKTTTDRRGLLLKPRQQAAELLTQKLGVYDRERRRLAAEAARVEEQRRLEAAKAAQAERAKALEVAGHAAAAAVVRSKPAAIAPVQVAAPPRPAAGVKLRDDWDVELVDAALVPRQWLVVDIAAIRAAVKRSGGTLVIPGVRNFERSGSTVR